MSAPDATPFRSLPPPIAETFAVAGDGGTIVQLYRLRDSRADGPVLLWGHCGSAAAGSYRPLLLDLARDHCVFAFDARGHGGSAVPPTAAAAGEAGPYHPDRFARDVAAVAARVAALVPGRTIHYAAHSLNAAAFLRLGSRMTAAFAAAPWGRIVLFEPPLYPPPDDPAHAEARQKNRLLVARTAVRRRAWPSREAMVDYLAGRGIFAAFSRDHLAIHVAATLRPAAAGGYELACPPEVEATMYAAFRDDSTWRALGAFPDPERIHLVGGDPGTAERDWVTAIVAGAARQLPGATLSVWPGHGHFMVFGDPGRAGRLIRTWIATA